MFISSSHQVADVLWHDLTQVRTTASKASLKLWPLLTLKATMEMPTLWPTMAVPEFVMSHEFDLSFIEVRPPSFLGPIFEGPQRCQIVRLHGGTLVRLFLVLERKVYGLLGRALLEELNDLLFDMLNRILVAMFLLEFEEACKEELHLLRGQGQTCGAFKDTTVKC